MDITKLPDEWRRNAPAGCGELVALRSKAYATCKAMNECADELEAALPEWTKIEWVGDYADPSTLPPEDMTCMWVEKETRFNDVSELWQLKNKANYTHWRPLIDLDYPPEQS